MPQSLRFGLIKQRNESINSKGNKEFFQLVDWLCSYLCIPPDVGTFPLGVPRPWNILNGGVASMDSFFTLLVGSFIPSACDYYEVFSEESRSGTLELLLTHPFRRPNHKPSSFLAPFSLSQCRCYPHCHLFG